MEETQEQEQFNPMSPENLLADLKQKADLLGIKYNQNISYAKLLEKVQDVTAEPETEEEPKELTEGEIRMALQDEMMALDRCIITCNDPGMKDWDMTPYYSVSNSLVTVPSQTIPLNVEWHVPRALLNLIKSMDCFISVKSKDEKGRTITTRKAIKKYNIQNLPPLTAEEIETLKAAQVMRDGL